MAINTASRSTSIALIKDRKVFAEKFWISENNEAEKLMPEVDKLLKSKKISYEDLNRVIVIKGPGSFTGLRVGIGLGNAISYVQKIPISSIDTFSFLRKRNSAGKTNTRKSAETASKKTALKEATLKEAALKEAASKNTALLLLAGKSEVYIQLREKEAPHVLKLEEAKKFLKEKGIKTIFGELLEEQKEIFKDFKFIKLKMTFGEAVASLSDKDLEKSKIVAPLYIKDPQISLPKPFK